MKNAVLFATNLAIGMAAENTNGGSNLGQILTNNLMSYVGLNQDTTSVDLAKDKSPRVKNFGFESAQQSDNGLVGYSIGLNADLGWNYELPLYNEDEYLVSRQRVSAYGGGRNFVSLTLYVVRVTVFFDVWLSKITADHYIRYDIVNYGDYCQAGQWLLDIMRASLLFQLDVNECVWGLVGSITSDTEDCEWGTYYIN